MKTNTVKSKQNSAGRALLSGAMAIWVCMLVPLTGWAQSSPLEGLDLEDITADLPNLDSLITDRSSAMNLSVSGYLKNETAYRIDEPRSFTKIRNVAYGNLRMSLGSRMKFNVAGWSYYDHVYDMFDYDTISARAVRDAKEPLVFIEGLQTEEDNEVATLREAYVDLYLKSLDLRIGKQYVIWGVLEGVRVVDEINPMDFRELILPELLDYRIPLWTFKGNFYPNSGGNLEFLVIPDLRFHQSAPRGSEWELFQTLDETTYPPSWHPAYAEYGVKYTRQVLDTEISLSWFYTWDDFPVVFRVIALEDIQGTQPTNSLPILPTYTRMTMYGMTFTREIGGRILKGEFAWVTDKYFAIKDVDRNNDNVLDFDGVVKRDHFRWGIGLDFTFQGADFSPAFTQWVITDFNSDILQDELDSAFNLFIRKPLRKRTAVFTLLVIKLVNFDETLMKPKLTFNLNNHFQMAIGMDLFVGDRTQFGRAFETGAPGNLVDIEQRAQFLGNFKDNRRIFVNFKYSF